MDKSTWHNCCCVQGVRDINRSFSMGGKPMFLNILTIKTLTIVVGLALVELVWKSAR